MYRKIATIAAITLLFACNNDKEKTASETTSATETTEADGKSATERPASMPAGSARVTYSVEGSDKTEAGSILVQKDKSNVSPGNEFFGIITSNSSNKESFNINILFSLKPGTYPVVGMSYSRDVNTKGQVYGGLLGGEPKLTGYNVNITECKNLGSNGMGGNKWSISGALAEEITIPAMGIMKMDKEHPADIKISKITFTNLTFDDNWDELMNKAMDQMNKNK